MNAELTVIEGETTSEEPEPPMSLPEWTPPSEIRQATPITFDISSVPEGTIEDKILFLRDAENAKIQDIAHTLNISSTAVYDVLMARG